MKEIKLSKNVIVKVELEVPAFEGTNITLSYPRISIDFAEAVFIKVFRTWAWGGVAAAQAHQLVIQNTSGLKMGIEKRECGILSEVICI